MLRNRTQRQEKLQRYSATGVLGLRLHRYALWRDPAIFGEIRLEIRLPRCSGTEHRAELTNTPFVTEEIDELGRQVQILSPLEGA